LPWEIISALATGIKGHHFTPKSVGIFVLNLCITVCKLVVLYLAKVVMENEAEVGLFGFKKLLILACKLVPCF